MAAADEHLSMLIDAATTAELRHFALGVSNSLKYTSSVEGPSFQELEEAEAALVAWKAATGALKAYQTRERWATNRD